MNEEDDEQYDSYNRADNEPDDIDSIHKRSRSDNCDDDDAHNGVVGGVWTRKYNLGKTVLIVT